MPFWFCLMWGWVPCFPLGLSFQFCLSLLTNQDFNCLLDWMLVLDLVAFCELSLLFSILVCMSLIFLYSFMISSFFCFTLSSMALCFFSFSFYFSFFLIFSSIFLLASCLNSLSPFFSTETFLLLTGRGILASSNIFFTWVSSRGMSHTQNLELGSAIASSISSSNSLGLIRRFRDFSISFIAYSLISFVILEGRLEKSLSDFSWLFSFSFFSLETDLVNDFYLEKDGGFLTSTTSSPSSPSSQFSRIYFQQCIWFLLGLICYWNSLSSTFCFCLSSLRCFIYEKVEWFQMEEWKEDLSFTPTFFAFRSFFWALAAKACNLLSLSFYACIFYSFQFFTFSKYFWAFSQIFFVTLLVNLGGECMSCFYSFYFGLVSGACLFSLSNLYSSYLIFFFSSNLALTISSTSILFIPLFVQFLIGILWQCNSSFFSYFFPFFSSSN